MHELITTTREQLRGERRRLLRYIDAVKGRVSRLPAPVRTRYSWVCDVDFQVGRLDLFLRLGAKEDAEEALRRLKGLLKAEPRQALPPVSAVAI